MLNPDQPRPNKPLILLLIFNIVEPFPLLFLLSLTSSSYDGSWLLAPGSPTILLGVSPLEQALARGTRVLRTLPTHLRLVSLSAGPSTEVGVLCRWNQVEAEFLLPYDREILLARFIGPGRNHKQQTIL